ncbi:hypothetical protein ACTVH1_18585 [Gluconobacter cerinus]
MSPVLLALGFLTGVASAHAQEFGIHGPGLGMNFLTNGESAYTTQGQLSQPSGTTSGWLQSGPAPATIPTPGPATVPDVTGVGFQHVATQEDAQATQKLFCIKQLEMKGLNPTDVLKTCDRLHLGLSLHPDPVDTRSSDAAGNDDVQERAARKAPVDEHPLPALPHLTGAATADGACDISRNLQALWSPDCLANAEKEISEPLPPGADVTMKAALLQKATAKSRQTSTPVPFSCRIQDGQGLDDVVPAANAVECLKAVKTGYGNLVHMKVAITRGGRHSVLQCTRPAPQGRLSCDMNG